jgi:hypothetical protein
LLIHSIWTWMAHQMSWCCWTLGKWRHSTEGLSVASCYVYWRYTGKEYTQDTFSIRTGGSTIIVWASSRCSSPPATSRDFHQQLMLTCELWSSEYNWIRHENPILTSNGKYSLSKAEFCSLFRGIMNTYCDNYMKHSV